MKIKDFPEDSRPREKLLKMGAENLSDPELLAILLRTGLGAKKGERGENAIELANRLINEYGLDKLSECSVKELRDIKGIGKAKACQIFASFELNKRINQSKTPIKKISCAEDVFNHFHERLKDKKEEHFYVLMLNTQNHIIGEQLISKGILDASIVHPREVFRPAIKNSASKIILVHNHPSGDPKPSAEDDDITRRLIKAGEGLGIKVIDSVIVGGGGWWSWKENK
ncbi:MAG: DNA repair protein RadC [Nanoarchaeota archaeon]|nr:DNA repair protein RadC [Nanoarchaeota archaeon]